MIGNDYLAEIMTSHLSKHLSFECSVEVNTASMKVVVRYDNEDLSIGEVSIDLSYNLSCMYCLN